MQWTAHGAQMSVLDGNAYDAKCLESGEERCDDLDSAALLLNNKAQPLLMPGTGGAHNASNRVVMQVGRTGGPGGGGASRHACTATPTNARDGCHKGTVSGHGD